MLKSNYTSNENYINMFNNTNTSTTNYVDPTLIFGPQRDSLYIVLPITVTYALIFITGLFGNIFTCIVIIRNKSMHTATNYYLFSLAISDLLLLVSGMPQEMYSMWSKWPYVFGPVFCVLRGLAAETSTNASVLTITLFTIERYLAICHPFQSYRMSKLSRATKHIILLWIVSMTLALPQSLQFGISEYRGVVMCLQTRVIIEHSFEISTFLFFFSPMIIITVLYSLIGLHLNQSNIGKRNTTEQEQNMLKHDNKIRIKRKHSNSTRRVINMLVAVVIAFFVCWAPFHAQRLVAIYGTTKNHHARSPAILFIYSILTYASGVFYYMSTCINPILYHIMSNKFRDAFKNTLLRCCGVNQRSAIQRCSYSALAFQRNATSSGTDNSGNSVRNETPGLHNSRRPDRNNIRVSSSVNSLNDNIRTSPQTREEYYTFYYGNYKELNRFNIQFQNNCQSLNCECNQNKEIDKPWSSVGHPGLGHQRRTLTQDSISNSSLKEAKKEDFDELAEYIKEMKVKISQREKDYG